MEPMQNHLESWAVVELMGHQKEVGFVTTQYYGTACLFKIDVPELPEREKTLKRPQWAGDTHVPAGTTISLAARPGRTRFIGVPAIYAINPCDREAALAVLEESGSDQIKIVSLAGCKQLPLDAQAQAVEEYGEDSGDDEDEEEDEDEDEPHPAVTGNIPF
jgi:hypothetical protein